MEPTDCAFIYETQADKGLVHSYLPSCNISMEAWGEQSSDLKTLFVIRVNACILKKSAVLCSKATVVHWQAQVPDLLLQTATFPTWNILNVLEMLLLKWLKCGKVWSQQGKWALLAKWPCHHFKSGWLTISLLFYLQLKCWELFCLCLHMMNSHDGENARHGRDEDVMVHGFFAGIITPSMLANSWACSCKICSITSA